jgi:hypothetical protein
MFSVGSVWKNYNRFQNNRQADKVKPDTENIRGLNFAVVKLTTVQVTRLPL